ncbi:MAG: hypothetical protein RLZZ440_437 [Planctomycetota bacterium]
MNRGFCLPRGRLLTAAAVVLFLPAAGLASHPGLCGTAADDLVAARAGLNREWVVQTPFDSQQWRLDRVVVGRDLVLVAAGDRSLTAIATGAGTPPAGTLLWSLPGDGTRFPLESIEIEPDGIAVARGGRLTVLDPMTGRSRGSGPLPPRLTTDRRVVVEVTEQDAVRRLNFDLGSPMSGPPVLRGTDVFVATTAGDIARIARSPSGLRATTGVGRDADGNEVAYTGWHRTIAEQPEGSPLVGGDTVVVSLGPAGLAAFHADTGEPLWRSCLASRPLAIIGGRVWCLDATGFLSARDLRTGRRVARLCVGGFTVPVIDPTGERLVLASPEGLVVSLAGRGPWPSKSDRGAERQPAGEQIDRQDDAADRERSEG